jgi:predicted metal-dependent hydrolase
MQRAQRLSHRHLAGRARPASVAWVGNQDRRWGSCTVEDATIRLSRRLQGMPHWVVDYVLLHELAHLIEPGHGPQFWELLAGYPHLERARGFLEGVTAVYDEGIGAPDGAPSRSRSTA